ncbi:early nodulin-like protein 1 [Striga asiatica]|uniref:Early nodulin-like protein 1 n=1 Tax=Striga asiatica TaxID=4170 RepID=A0A5A7RAJ4_STRAF|nr:early nodulin-like protein 1 [Striga asiatica]
MELALATLIIIGFLCSSSKAHTFNVGGEDGWTLHPSDNYTLWAEKYRFEINDQLVFKYKQGHDTVLVVNRNDYTKCNKENPIRSFKGGHSVFKFKKSGPFYFISGHDQNCEKGQKFEVIVLSKNHHFPTPSPEAGPTAHAPTVEPPSHSPSPSPTAGKTSSPASEPPSRSPSPSPAAGKNPTRISPVEPPSRSRSTPPVAKAPAKEPLSHSPSPSPSLAAGKIPTRISPVEPPTHSPSQAESPKKSYGAPEPDTEHHHRALPPRGHHGLHFGLRPIFLFGY